MATSKIPLLGAIKQVQLIATVDPDTGEPRTSDNPANTLARVVGLDATDKLSFVATAGLGAVVHITPGA
jgi:hypothetical protein